MPIPKKRKKNYSLIEPHHLFGVSTMRRIHGAGLAPTLVIAEESFQSKGFWMVKGAGCLTDGDMPYDSSSRMEPKRAHQWCVNATESDLFLNKKQAVEASNSKSVSGISGVSISPWENTSNCHSVSGQFTDRLFGSEEGRNINFFDRNIPSLSTVNLNMGRKGIEDQYGNDSSVGLSISHTMEDPGFCLSYGGIRKVKINQVKDADDGMSVSMLPLYNKVNDNTISMGQPYSKRDDNTISMGQPYSKEDDSIISMGHPYNKGDASTISIGQPLNKGDSNIMSMGHTYKGDGNTVSMVYSYNRGHGNIISMGHTYDKGDGSSISMGDTYGKGDASTISMGHIYKGDGSTIPVDLTYDKSDKNMLSMGHTKDNTTISFGGFHDDSETSPSGRLISYDLLKSQSSVQPSEAQNEKEAESDAGLVTTARIDPSGTETVSKNNKMELRMAKKVALKNFPSNVRSLLSTGILDGVPVKYISWSREKELHGVIKGSGYLCSCQSCNFSKVLNAYEYERHAGCKTKHPNNHIFFENGKTIYGIVQELRSTPQNLLFEAIQSVTGSPINQKSFRIWKESFQAATRELQRIFGKDEASKQSQNVYF